MRIQEDGTSTDIEMFSEFATSGRVVVFDTETTGGSCSDEICQLAAAEYVHCRLEQTIILNSGTPRQAWQNLIAERG